MRDKQKRTKNRIKDLEKGEKNVLLDLKGQSDTMHSLKSEMLAINKREKALRVEQEAAAEGGLQLAAEEVVEYGKLREELSAQTGAERAEEISIQQEISSKSNRIDRLSAQEQSLRLAIESGDKLIVEYTDRAAKLAAAVASSERELEKINSTRQKLTLDSEVFQQVGAAIVPTQY